MVQFGVQILDFFYRWTIKGGHVETAKLVFTNAYIVTDRVHFYAHKTKYIWLKNEVDLTEKEKKIIQNVLLMDNLKTLKIAYE